MSQQLFRISGIVEELETKRPLSGLIVRAFDKDVAFDDDLGMAVTDEVGLFRIEFSEAAFRDVWERRPDLYLRIYDPTGSWVVHESSDAVRWNATPDERFQVAVPGSMLLPPSERANRRP